MPPMLKSKDRQPSRNAGNYFLAVRLKCGVPDIVLVGQHVLSAEDPSSPLRIAMSSYVSCGIFPFL
jgi:hypothetical protein